MLTENNKEQQIVMLGMMKLNSIVFKGALHGYLTDYSCEFEMMSKRYRLVSWH